MSDLRRMDAEAVLSDNEKKGDGVNMTNTLIGPELDERS